MLTSGTTIWAESELWMSGSLDRLRVVPVLEMNCGAEEAEAAIFFSTLIHKYARVS